jgi:hypothetical protein
MRIVIAIICNLLIITSAGASTIKVAGTSINNDYPRRKQ